MKQKPGFLGYIAAAFNARPIGMFVAPNWIGVAAVGLLGLANPGFWVLGAGLELGYLLLLGTNSRFQRFVDAKSGAGKAEADWNQKIEQTLSTLGRDERERYESLAARCRSILEIQQRTGAAVPEGLEAQAQSLGKLTWMYLRLLAARHAILHVLDADDADSTADLEERRAALERQLAADATNAELTRSRQGQVEILRQRVERRNEAERKRAFIDAELERIEEQVELIREQAALSTDPEGLSRRIDEITATLGGTSQWIRDQQQVFGAMEDLLSDPPPVGAAPGRTRARESE